MTCPKTAIFLVFFHDHVVELGPPRFLCVNCWGKLWLPNFHEVVHHTARALDSRSRARCQGLPPNFDLVPVLKVLVGA